jgi:hypothetical protein
MKRIERGICVLFFCVETFFVPINTKRITFEMRAETHAQ